MHSRTCLHCAGHCLEKFPLKKEETIKNAMQKLTKPMTDKCISLAKLAK